MKSSAFIWVGSPHQTVSNTFSFYKNIIKMRTEMKQNKWKYSINFDAHGLNIWSGYQSKFIFITLTTEILK